MATKAQIAAANKQIQEVAAAKAAAAAAAAATQRQFGVIPGAGNLYRLGAMADLPPGSIAGASPEETYTNLVAKGAGYVLTAARWMTGQDWSNNPAGAREVILKGLRTYGTAPGGIAGSIQQGSWNQSAGTGSSRNNGQGSNNSNVTLGGSAGSGDYSLSAATAAAKISALDTLDTDLGKWGLQSLTGWVYNEVMAPSEFKPSAQILLDMKNTDEYKQRFSGMAVRAANGLAPIDENQYIQNENSYLATARQYGLPQGFMTPTEIGILIGHDVSAKEFDDRVINGYRVAMQADPNTKATLKEYYGIDDGGLAAYWLDPNRAYDVMMKQQQSAMIGGMSKDTGFGGLDKSVAETLASQAIGSPSSMDSNYFRTQFSKIAPLVPLQATMAGQRGQATVTKNQLLETGFSGLTDTLGGTQADAAAALKLAEQARTAGLSGGGGYVQDAGGGVGVGRTSTAGTGK